MPEPVVGADDADRAQLRLRVLLADPAEDRALLQGRAQHLEHVGATLQRGHQLVDPRQVGEVRLGEQPRDAVHVEGLAVRRSGGQRHQVGDLGQRRRRLPHRVVHLPPQPRQLQLDPGVGGRRARRDQHVDIAPVAGIGGNPPGRGMRMGQIPRSLKGRQFRPHSGGSPLNLGPLSDLLRRNRLRRPEIRSRPPAAESVLAERRASPSILGVAKAESPLPRCE